MTPICIPRTPVAKFGHQSQPELFDNVASSTEGQGGYTRAATYPNYGQAFADPRRVLLPLRSRTTTYMLRTPRPATCLPVVEPHSGRREAQCFEGTDHQICQVRSLDGCHGRR